MHAHIVAPMDRTLVALSGILTKAEAHCEAKGIKPEALLAFRLYPDMFSFTRQVQLTCDFCARAAARLAGAEPKSFPDTETSFAELQARIAAARSPLGEYLVRSWERVALVEGESLVYWLRKLVFRGAWLDHQVKRGAESVRRAFEVGVAVRGRDDAAQLAVEIDAIHQEREAKFLRQRLRIGGELAIVDR